MSEINPLDPVPIYRQLAAILRGQIERGEIQPRQPLPSETTLIQRYGVARGTVRHAIKLLNDEEVVITIQGRGTYVLPLDGERHGK